MKIFKYLAESFFIYLFFLVIKLTSLNFGRKVFSYIFKKIGPLIRSNTLIEKNLTESLQIDRDNTKKIIRKMWSNYGMLFVEYLHLHKFKKQSSHINIKGAAFLREIKKKNRPVVFVSGHFSNFELMSMEIRKSDINLATIYRPLNNFFINPLMEHIRKKNVCAHQIKKGKMGTRKAIKYIKNNFSIALMIDQRVSEGKNIPFFNRNALTTTLPAQIAIKFNIDIVPVYISRDNKNNFNMEVFEPIKISSHENLEKQKIEITLKLNKFLENMISQDPGQWIWTHNRWK